MISLYQMQCYITDIILLPQTIQACEIFNEKRVQHVLANTVFLYMYKRRKIFHQRKYYV